MDNKEELEELEKCKNDIVYFIEKYMIIGDKPIILKEHEKEFLRKYHKEMNSEQLRFVISGMRVVDRFKTPDISFLPDFLKKLPQKNPEEFVWNLQKPNKDDN